MFSQNMSKFLLKYQEVIKRSGNTGEYLSPETLQRCHFWDSTAISDYDRDMLLDEFLEILEKYEDPKKELKDRGLRPQKQIITKFAFIHKRNSIIGKNFLIYYYSFIFCLFF